MILANNFRALQKWSTTALVAVATVSASPTSVPVTPQAARSVHLAYVLPDAEKNGVVGFYCEVTVEQSVKGSYFEVCGYSGGYFGIQERGDKKVGIFSVWDMSKGNDPKAVAKTNRVETLYTGAGVRSSRFGGEGTGGHSDFDCDWVIGQTYGFYLCEKIDGKKTDYIAYFFDPSKKKWMHVATFAAPDGGRRLAGLYSFIEDFRRDTASANDMRRARFGNGWVKTITGHWLPLTKAVFTASGSEWEAKDTIDAGVVGGNCFFLQTGGNTRTHNPLQSPLQLQTFQRNRPTLPPGVD